MTISIFVCVINPQYWCFPYLEALRCYCDLADEVLVIDSGSRDGSLEKIKALSPKIRVMHSDWPWEFKQREYPKHYNLGFSSCSGDWVLKMDIDHLFHHHDILRIRAILQEHHDNKNFRVATFQRFNFLNRYFYYDKGRMLTAIHKRFTKDKIKVGIPNGEDNTDWTIPLEVEGEYQGVPYGRRVDPIGILNMGIPIFNYDCFFRPKDKCQVWYRRIARAMQNEGRGIYGKDDQDAWEHWKLIRLEQRDKKPLKNIKISHHPEYIQDKLNSMTPDMWAFNNWEWKL